MASSGVFNAFRSNGAPTYYGPNKTPFMADILEAGLMYAFAIVAFSFFLILPGIRGNERIYMFIRVTVTLFIGGVVMLCNYGFWETAESTNVRTKYKAGSAGEITADIQVLMTLRGINVTLKAEGKNRGPFNETINYNENFDWRWEQGRLGFGIYAGRFNREFREAQFRGTPLPIIWIAEYFTFDGEGIRWGRHYRQAGWYAHILMWLAFPLWILTIILFFMLLKYGAYMLSLTGATMIGANIAWATVRNVNPLVIPFSAEHKLEFHYGPCFYLNLFTGILCILLGALIWFLDLRYPEDITNFFGVDPLQAEGFEEIDAPPLTKDVKKVNGDELKRTENGEARGDGPSSPVADFEDDDDDDAIYEPPPLFQPQSSQGSHFEKRRSRGLTQSLNKLQKPRRRPPPPILDDDLYCNQGNDSIQLKKMRYHP